MKIAFVVSSFKANFFHEMIKFLPASIEPEIIDATKTCFNTKIWFLPSRLLLKELRAFRPDVVYTDYPHYPTWYAKVYQALAKRDVPVIAHLRGDWWAEYYNWLATAPRTDRLFGLHRYYFTYTGLALADAVTPICNALNKIVLRHFPFKKTLVVHQGVNPDSFYEESGVYLRHPNVCIVQNHTIWPKVRGLLQFAKVVRQMPDVHFYISRGQSITQTYAPLVKRTFAALPNVHMLGSVDSPSNLRQLLTAADVYVLASGLDMCPTTVLEASLMEKPVVASRVGGVPEIIKEGLTGYTIPNENIALWIQTIRTVLNNKGLAKKLGRTGRDWVSENFNWTKIGMRTLDAIKFASNTDSGYRSE